MTRVAIAMVFAICFAAAAGLGSEDEPHPSDAVWEVGTGDDIPVAVAVDGDGAIVIVGATVATVGASEDVRSRPYVSMLDASGRPAWTRRDLQGTLTAVTIDSAGAVTVVGTAPAHTSSTEDDDVVVARLDARGGTLWVRRLTKPHLPPNLDLDDARSLIGATAAATDDRGNVAIVGSTWLVDGPFTLTQDTYVTLLDADGATRWSRTLEHSAPDSGWAVAFDPTGDVVVVGGAWGAIDGADGTGTGAYVWKLDSTGRTRWVTQFGASIDDTPTGVAIAADGTILVVGDGYHVHEPSGGSGAFVRAFDAEGAPTWTRAVGHPAQDDAQGIVVDAHGNALVLTNRAAPCSPRVGATVWGFTGAGEDAGHTQARRLDLAVGHALAQDATGNMILAGTSRCSGDEQGFVIKTARDGSRAR